jgi:hypothetical protein
MPLTQQQRLNASERSKQIVQLQHLHREIGDEWAQGYHAVINAVEAALSAMEEAEAEINSESLEA